MSGVKVPSAIANSPHGGHGLVNVGTFGGFNGGGGGSYHVSSNSDYLVTVLSKFDEKIKEIQERLTILVPDPEKLAKYEALQLAYKEYKTLEALLND